MEALCSTRSSECTQNIETCLNALYTLLDSEWARKVLMKNKSLSVELCNVLHRYNYLKAMKTLYFTFNELCLILL